MRSALVQLSLFLAVAATVGLAFFVNREKPEPPDPPGPAATDERPEGRAVGPAPAEPRLRPYQTADTLREDLRDALGGPADELHRECWRVSEGLRKVARWTLVQLAPHEASPKVRALLVLAAGVHVPDDGVLRVYLEDRAPLVRAAAVLATGHRDRGGTDAALFLGAVTVPIGRVHVEHLKAAFEAETDAMVKDAYRAVLAAAGLSSRR